MIEADGGVFRPLGFWSSLAAQPREPVTDIATLLTESAPRALARRAAEPTLRPSVQPERSVDDQLVSTDRL